MGTQTNTKVPQQYNGKKRKEIKIKTALVYNMLKQSIFCLENSPERSLYSLPKSKAPQKCDGEAQVLEIWRTWSTPLLPGQLRTEVVDPIYGSNRSVLKFFVFSRNNKTKM